MELHIYRNAQDREQDLRAVARERGAALAFNSVTLGELVQRLTPDVREVTPGQRLVLTIQAVGDAIPVRYALETLSELKSVRATPTQLRSAGAPELAQYLEDYDRLLRRSALVDAQDRRWLAASRVRESTWLQRFESVTLHALYDLIPSEFTLLHHLLEFLPGGGSVMMFNATSNIKPTQFAERTWQRFVYDETLSEKIFPEFFRPSGPARDLIERLFVFDSEASQQPLRAGGWLKILNCSGRYGEIESIAGSIKDDLEAGADPNEMALVVRHIDTYGEMIEDVFSRYGIQCVFETGVPLLRVPFIKYWLALLDLVSGERPRDAVARVMASAYRQPRLSPALDAERMLIEIGYIDRRHLKASALAARHGSKLVVEIERFELLLDGLEQASATPAEFLRRLSPPADLLAGRDLHAWETLSEEIGAVDDLMGVVPFERFRRIAAEISGLRTIQGFSGRPIAPGSPRMRVISPNALGYRSYRRLFAPGFADGEIPAPSSMNPLLTDEVVAAVNGYTQPHRLQKSFQRNRKEPLYLFLLLDSAAESVTLTCPGSTLEGEAIHSSIYVGEILRHCDPADTTISAAAPWRPRESGEFKREVASAWRADLLEAAHAGVLLGADLLKRARWERSGPARADLGSNVFPVDVKFSPSELDRLEACPFVFLARHRLRLQVPDAPDFEVSPREVGTLAHRILREFYLQPAGDSESAARDRMKSIVDRQLAPVDINGQGPHSVIDPSLWRIRRPQLERALLQYVTFAVSDARDGYETLTEYLDENLPASRLGNTLLGGRPDHIAVRKSLGSLTGIRIDDFKYSAASSVTNRKLQDSFQIPIYAHLASAALGTGPEVSIEGRYLLLRSPSTPSVKRSVDSGLLDEIRERLDGLIEKIRLGRLHPEPMDREDCRTCDYRRLCRLYGD